MLDPSLLKAARELGLEVSGCERELDRVKADYHHAIRALHLNGATMREIGQALGLSHQRVGQIVKAGSGSWIQRLRAFGEKERSLECSFCGSASSVVEKLVAGPSVHICDRCIAAARSVVGGGEAPQRMMLAVEDPKKRCSFCGKATHATRAIVGNEERGCRICTDCLPLAEQFADSDAPSLA